MATATNLHPQGSKQSVVPIRFERAVDDSGPPDDDAPALDDRGYRMPRPPGWNETEARGPMVGIMVGDTVRIKVIREDLNWCAPLYATTSSSSDPQVELIKPEGGGEIPRERSRSRSSGFIEVKAIASTSEGQTVQIRLGDMDGPILGELEPHTFTPRRLNLALHVCEIHGPQKEGSIPRIGDAKVSNPSVLNRLMSLVRSIWRPAGIDFIESQHYDVYEFAHADLVLKSETAQLVNQNHVRGHCNLYLIPYLHGSVGIADDTPISHPDYGNWNYPAAIDAVEGFVDDDGEVRRRDSLEDQDIADLRQEVANSMAHEIGHYLTLPHAGAVDSPGLPDTFARQQLMFPVNPLSPARHPEVRARFNDVGYGIDGEEEYVVVEDKKESFERGHRGCLLTMKRYETHAMDGDVARARTHIISGNLH